MRELEIIEEEGLGVGHAGELDTLSEESNRMCSMWPDLRGSTRYTRLFIFKKQTKNEWKSIPVGWLG